MIMKEDDGAKGETSSFFFLPISFSPFFSSACVNIRYPFVVFSWLGYLAHSRVCVHCIPFSLYLFSHCAGGRQAVLLSNFFFLLLSSPSLFSKLIHHRRHWRRRRSSLYTHSGDILVCLGREVTVWVDSFVCLSRLLLDCESRIKMALFAVERIYVYRFPSRVRHV